jgi:hypothetical protein
MKRDYRDEIRKAEMHTIWVGVIWFGGILFLCELLAEIQRMLR